MCRPGNLNETTDAKSADPAAGMSYQAVGGSAPSIEHFIEDKIDDLLNQIQRLQRLRRTVRNGYLPADVTEFMKEAVVRL